MDREDKFYIDLDKLGHSDENESLVINEKNYPVPNKLYNIENDEANWPEDAEDYIYWHSESDKWAEDYAKSYKVKMSPKDFLDLTTTDGADSLKVGDRLGLGKLRNLDIDEFNKEQHQNIFLQIAFKDYHYLAQVVGHEGRHRMFALMQAGVKSVDVELICDVWGTEYNKYKPFKLDYIDLIGQFNKSVKVRVYNPIAMSWKQHKAIRPNLKDEGLNEYLDTVRVDDTSEFPVFATDDVYKLKALLQRADKPYRIYNDDETYYFQDALGDFTHYDMLQQALETGWLANSKLRYSEDDEDDVTSGEIYPEDFDEGYLVFIPKNFNGQLRYHTTIGDDGYYSCKCYSFGDIFVRDSSAYKNDLFDVLGEADRTLYYSDYPENKVSVTDKNGDTREFDVDDDLDGNPQYASTIDLSTKEPITEGLKSQSYLSDFIVRGPAFITKEGKFLRVSGDTHKSVFEFDEFKDYEDANKSVAQFCEEQGYIRVNDGSVLSNEVYINLPTYEITDKQYNALTEYLDYIVESKSFLSVDIVNTMNYKNYYLVDDYVFADDVMADIKRYYKKGNFIDEELLENSRTAEELLNALDKEFGQEDVYMWSTYILPNGHFLNPDNASEYFDSIDEEPGYEHYDFEDWAYAKGYNLNDIYDNCVKMNVTVPYISMPDKAKPTQEQLKAVKKIIDNKDYLDSIDSSYIRDILPPEQVNKIFRDAVGKLVLFYTPMGHKVFDLGVSSADDIVKAINKAYAIGQFLERINLKEDSGRDTFKFNGKKAWSGAVNTLDGTIEEVHSYRQAKNVGFHHSFYFSDEQLDKMEEGDSCFFCVYNDHTILVNATNRFNSRGDDIELREDYLINRIKEQIEFIDDVNEELSRDEIEDRVANELGTSKEPIEGPSYILRDGSFLKIWNSNKDIKGMSGSKSVSGKTMHLDVDGYINKEVDSDAYSYYYLNVDCIRVNTGFEEYIVLPKYRPNNAQFESLEKWLNYYFFDKGHEKLKVMDWYGSYLNTKEYYLDTTMPEEIIKKIKRFYATGKLVEKIVKLDSGKWQVQSEKGRNLGTYDTKAEAEKRLGQVEYFKHLSEDYEPDVYYRGYDSRYGVFDSDNKYGQLYTWVTDEPEYALEYAEGNEYGKVAKVRITCSDDEIGGVLDLPEDVDYYDPGDEEFQECILDQGLKGYGFEAGDYDDYCICISKDCVEVIDDDFKVEELHESREDFFKSSVVRDASGNLLPVYHCSFSEFDTFAIDQEDGTIDTKDWHGEFGFAWFTDDLSYAENYGDGSYTYECYLNITHPLDLGEINYEVESADSYEGAGRNKIKDDYSDTGYLIVTDEYINLCKKVNVDPEVMIKYYHKWWETGALYDLTRRAFFKNLVVKLGYDGVTATEGGNRTWGCVRSNQIKLVSNENPTDKDSMKEDVNTKVGYRHDFDENRETDLRSVIEFETVELGNVDILDTILNNFEVDNKELVQKAIDEEASDEEVQQAIDECIKAVQKKYPDAKYCLWLCDSKEDVWNNYIEPFEHEGTIDDVYFSKYTIECETPISDLGDEGKLYVFTKQPRKIEEMLEEYNDTIYYHGSATKGLTKLTSPINWITEDKDYAKYYALAISGTAYVYTCEADLDNIFDAGNTGVRVFALLPITKPYKLSVEFGNLYHKLDISNERAYKLVEDAIAEYPQNGREYATKISTVVRSNAFKKILQEKGYTSIHTIEYNVPHGRYCDCYGILDSDDVKILSSEEVTRDAKLNDK